MPNTTVIEREELVELLILCLKGQGFIVSHEELANIIADVAYTDDNEEIKFTINGLGKALIDASEHIK